MLAKQYRNAKLQIRKNANHKAYENDGKNKPEYNFNLHMHHFI
jgi:hypothetical protein